ncbi:nuclear transport factor 2 family protein [Flaviflexus huanghaiensis]|uniref:nuclear transport factor 2 family protein n=1 Tax=Flaviflexus huanghaiensis TaxID=1111473 RepID=UPI0015FA8D68|nr:nuclear transport factor 2 family protein [Flaviflexus huanghaiensis]
MALIDDLLTNEQRLSTGDTEFYRQTYRPDALFIMPSMVASLDEAIAGLKQSPPWDEYALTNVTLRMLGTDAAAIIYRFTGSREGQTYSADMVSTYERVTQWQLVLHQQTPLV